MKFIHTSDWHIGRQFHNVSLLDDQKHVLSQIVQHIKDEDVDALVIAGDIYDRSVPPASAVKVLDEVLHEIVNTLKVPVILISGNHDSAERLRFGARQLKPSGLHILGDLNNVTKPVTILGKSGIAVNFFGIPYNDPEQVRSQYDEMVKSHDDAHTFLVKKISDAINQNNFQQAPNVLISHCFVDGAEASESERPLSIGGADRVSFEPMKAFNYVALGHLHSPQFRGQPTIRYSGSILKYSFSEQHQTKAVTLVEFSTSNVDTPNAHASHHPAPKNTAPAIKQLPITPLRDMRILEGQMSELLTQGKADPNADDYLMVRLTDTHAILDAMGKLRDVYPNVLHLEKPGIMATGEKKALNRDQLKRSELEMFHDFFAQVSGNPLSENQQQAIKSVISTLHNQTNADAESVKKTERRPAIGTETGSKE